MSCCGKIRSSGLIGSTGDFAQFRPSLGSSSWSLPLDVGVGDVGNLLTAEGGTSAFRAPIENALLYRNSTVALVNGSQWLAQWYSNNSFAAIGDAGYAVALRTGTLRWLRVYHGVVAASELLTYIVVVGGVDTILSVSLNADSLGPVQNINDEVAVNAGDLISMRVSGLSATKTVRMGADFFLQ
jgi:hypothetical protein